MNAIVSVMQEKYGQVAGDTWKQFVPEESGDAGTLSFHEDAAGQDIVRVGAKHASEQSDHARASKKQQQSMGESLIPGVPNSALVSHNALHVSCSVLYIT